MYKYQDFTIRNLQKSDYSIVIDIINSIRLEYGVIISKEYDQDMQNYIAVEKYYLETGGLFWVVEKDNKILGTAAFYPYKGVEKGAEIKKIYLLPEVRGIGLGKFLLQQLELEIAARGFQTIWIKTVSLFNEAMSLYENSGYVQFLDLETPKIGYIYAKKSLINIL
ncbi:GNAT family N-acetyltransferase [Nodularia sp. NIES-3585]|uniref:GNAT family N-acetyltransferase n=1 Tax=Nodularia sp. NIES-3585 TaxID=1973477 RepID=UPI000B5C257E|nr:GNAT family N-acetyltransferase [Nodularia sp. NIES-3585]GAX35337.1 GCN5-related N-acetyltransferase [Nodularia sp. NIES-3585]